MQLYFKSLQCHFMLAFWRIYLPKELMPGAELPWEVALVVCYIKLGCCVDEKVTFLKFTVMEICFPLKLIYSCILLTTCSDALIDSIVSSDLCKLSV